MVEWPDVEDRPAREALLLGLADAVRLWQAFGASWAGGEPPVYAERDEAEAARVLSEAIRTPGQRRALELVLGRCLSGLVHSALVELDGAARTPPLDIRTAEEGRSLGVALHEEWPSFDPHESRARS